MQIMHICLNRQIDSKLLDRELDFKQIIIFQIDNKKDNKIIDRQINRERLQIDRQIQILQIEREIIDRQRDYRQKDRDIRDIRDRQSEYRQLDR